MQKRYTDSYFSLLALQIVMDTESSTYDLIIEFSKLLRSTFRTTDFCSKVDTNTFIFLFAKADLSGANVIKARIDSFLNSIKLTRGKFDIKTEYFSSTQENIAEENGQQLIGKLTNKL
jgi:GGDEF domain-containing protein